MFVIKYDKLSMIKLIKSIEKHPAIYNTRVVYSKDQVDAAWDKVSIEVGEKDSLCRDKWHSIKSCYIRHLKYTVLNSKRRPYYLAEYLEFLAPHVSDRLRHFAKVQSFRAEHLPAYLREALPLQDKPSSELPSCIKDVVISEKTSGSSSIDFEEVSIKTELVDYEEVSESDLSSLDNSQPSSSKSVTKRSFDDFEKSPKRKKALLNHSGNRDNVLFNRSNNRSDIPKSSKKSKSLQNNSDDPHINFFKSLLPDILRMSSHQKLKFKQETLSIVEDVLYASEELINVTE